MDYLIKNAEEYGLRDILKIATSYDSVQGVVVYLDPMWLFSWHAEERQLPLDLFWDRLHYSVFLSSLSDSLMGFSDGVEFGAAIRPDLFRKLPYWEHLCELGIRQPEVPPLVVTITIRPDSKPLEVDWREFKLPVVTEVRPVARLAGDPKAHTRPVIGGLSVGSGTGAPGTLGGIVEDSSGIRYGMTCFHVLPTLQFAEQPAQTDGAAAAQIGQVRYSKAPIAASQDAPCNPYQSDSPVSELDLALIKLDPQVSSDFKVLDIGTVDGLMPKNSMSPGLVVELTGRTSGYRRLKIGGIAATYKFKDGAGAEYCFKDLFEVRWPRFWGHALGRPVSQGDSGAWVCAQGSSGTEWAGMVVGEDRWHGYAILSENVQSHLSGVGFDVVCA